MSDQTVALQPFTELLRHYRALYDDSLGAIARKYEKTGFTAEQYRIFRANYIARTMFTMPEAVAATLQACLDFAPLRTVYGALTVIEEAGEGKADQLHPHLMMQSLNAHGAEAFGLEPIDGRELMRLIRLLDNVQQAIAWEKTVGDLPERDKAVLRESGAFDVDGLRDQCRRQAVQLGILGESAAAPALNSLLLIEVSVLHRFRELGVITEIIDYGLGQLRAMRNAEPGYIEGVAYAHEGLADEVMYDVFRLMHADREKYRNPANFMQEMYPYFAVHGEYLAMIGGMPNPGDGVEALHALRETEKILELPPEDRDAAMRGARAFAVRNEAGWKALQKALDACIAAERAAAPEAIPA